MQHVTSADGTRIAFERLGAGPPLLLVTGALNDRTTRNAGMPLAKLLAERHTVICYDRRGRGDSSDTAPYALAREVEDMAALLSQLGGTPDVYGHSSGGLLALAAAHAGLPIRKLALYEPPLALSALREPTPVDMVEQLVRFTEHEQRSEAVELFLSRAVRMPELALQKTKHSPHWPVLMRLAHTLSYDALLADNPEAIVERAKGLRLPTQVYDGERSAPWMRAAVEILVSALPFGVRQSLPGQSHEVDPLQLAPKLLTFFGD
ncbi:MAG TPA: alpha/beta hydrolase [Polyangiaceae bacterium]|nr:alpha/beta hydrolase [Polyangiaceae bacterium]